MKLNAQALYCIRNKKTGHMNIGYTLDELTSYLTSFNLKDKFNWYIWCADWDVWKPASGFQQLLGNIHREMPDPPEFNIETQVEKKSSFQKKAVIEIQTIDINNIPDLEIEGQAGYEKRTFERVNKKMQIKIIGDEESFRTYSVDVSAGGLLLKSQIPLQFSSPCLLQVKKIESNQAVEVECEILTVENKRNRISFVGFDNKKVQKRFYYWLIS